VERVVKSFGFSLALFLIFGAMTVSRGRSLFTEFRWMELLWLFYNGTLCVLFLIRSRPSVVSLHPVHWLVALLTSFSGLFLQQRPAAPPALETIADVMIVAGILASVVAGISLGRSYDVFPALRGLTTGWIYGLIRHPMYLSSIVIRLGYVLKHPSAYNLLIFAGIVWLYDLRAGYEESVLENDPRYADYRNRVRFRFVPGIR